MDRTGGRQSWRGTAALLLLTACLAVVPAGPGRTTASSFSFAASGDLGGRQRSEASLLHVAAVRPDFFLAVGDLSYGEVEPVSLWCQWVQQSLGPAFPFELISGNHESGGQNGSIDEFSACLPNRLPGMVGAYAKEYYVDYPVDAPLARVIAISPGLTFPGEAPYDYTGPTAHRVWLEQAIRGARAAGIPWVFVGMHKVCLSAGVYGCDIGPGLLDLLVGERVDLVLQGHEHGYLRSKQLALGPACGSVAVGSYAPGCVSDDGASGTYRRGGGTVFAVSGVFGHEIRPVKQGDTEAPYFCRLMGANLEPTAGFLHLTVSAARVDVVFVPTDAGPFRDRFTIG